MTMPDGVQAFRRELLRWNDSINLVSRRGTAERIDALILQCADALRGWLERGGELGLETAGRQVLYVDIGSGGGFPAMIWHEQLARRADRLQTVLVEPREKRAWFLERVARHATAPVPEVHACRWGEVPAGGALTPELIVVSLKALRLPDDELWPGLASFLAPVHRTEVAIARFHPQDQIWSSELAGSLSLLAKGETAVAAGSRVACLGSGVLPGRDASLVISRYQLDRSS